MSTTNIRPGLPGLSPAQRLVAVALTEIPDTTVNDLAKASRTSKSTVAKALLKLEQAGAARRTLHEDGDTRFADTWSPTVLTGAILVGTAAEEPGYGHAAALSSALGDGPMAVASEDPELNHVIDLDEAGADITHLLDAADSMSPTALEDTGRVGLEEPDAIEGEDPETAARQYAPDGGDNHVAEDGTEDSHNVPDTATVPTEPNPAPAGSAAHGAASPSSGRLAPGALGAMVAAHLMAHPGKDFTPTELSHVLGGKSSGAIYNALVKMKEAATAIQTCESPRRFRHAPCAEAA